MGGGYLGRVAAAIMGPGPFAPASAGAPDLAPTLPPEPGAKELPGYRAVPADLTSESAAGGNRAGFSYSGLSVILAWLVDEIDRRFDDEYKTRMLTDPAVAAPIKDLGLGLVEHPLRLMIPERYRVEPGREPKAAQAEIDRANEVLEFDRLALQNLGTPIESVLLSMSDYPAYSCQLAEAVFEVSDAIEGGPWLLPSMLKPKPRDAWQFAVDPFWNVVGIAGTTPDDPTPVVFPPDKFLWLTWWPKGSDPRGRSLIREAAPPWNAKVRTTPDLLKYCRRFGIPLVWGKTPEGAMPQPSRDSTTGAVIPGRDKTPQQLMLADLLNWMNGVAIALAHGSEIGLEEPKGKGEALLNSLAYWDKQIVLAIASSTRSYLESQFGSRADSETSADVVARLKTIMRREASRAVVWRLLHLVNRLNFGDEDAALYTPDATLDAPEQGDLAKDVSAWGSAGWTLAPEHYAEIDGRLGLTPRAEPPEPADPQPDGEGGGSGGGSDAGGQRDQNAAGELEE